MPSLVPRLSLSLLVFTHIVFLMIFELKIFRVFVQVHGQGVLHEEGEPVAVLSGTEIFFSHTGVNNGMWEWKHGNGFTQMTHTPVL